MYKIKFKLLFTPDIGSNIIKYTDDKSRRKYILNESACPINVFLHNISHEFVDENHDFYLFNKYGKLKPKDFCDSAYPNDKKIIVIWITDNEDCITNTNMILYRTSLLNSKRGQNEYVLPWCTPYKWDIQYPLKHPPLENIYTTNPTIGFCGQVNNTTVGGKYREQIINVMSKNENIICDFLIRDRFIRDYPEPEQTLYRSNGFITNLENNMFGLAVRGGGNWSLRFYEIMAYGRIPVLLDTNSILPCEDVIDWDDIIIRSSNINELCKKMIEWCSNGPNFIYNQQNKCRQIWEIYLSIPGFSNEINKQLLNIK